MDKLTEAIEAAFSIHPLSEEVLRFLAANEGAMDTLQGIARCWVDSDEMALQPVLEELVSLGVIVSHIVSSGTYYRLTSDRTVREQLKAHLASRARQEQPAPGGSNGAPVHG